LAARINTQPFFRRDWAPPGDANRTGAGHTFDCLSDALDDLPGCHAAWFKMSRSDVDARVPVHDAMIMQPPVRVQSVPPLFSTLERLCSPDEPHCVRPQANLADYGQPLK
jgi:hypothetical protein